MQVHTLTQGLGGRPCGVSASDCACRMSTASTPPAYCTDSFSDPEPVDSGSAGSATIQYIHLLYYRIACGSNLSSLILKASLKLSGTSQDTLIFSISEIQKQVPSCTFGIPQTEFQTGFQVGQWPVLTQKSIYQIRSTFSVKLLIELYLRYASIFQTFLKIKSLHKDIYASEYHDSSAT